MSLSSRLTLCFVGVALLSGGSIAAAGNSTTAPATPHVARPLPTLTPALPGVDSATPVDAFWTPLPSRYDSGWDGYDLMRVEWDREAQAWGPARGGLSSASGAGTFGARLPSDGPVQVARADGSVMLLLGPESMEFAFARLGPDGRFHWTCAPDAQAAGQPVAPMEDR